MKTIELEAYDQRRTHTSAVWNTIQQLRLRYLDEGNGKNFYGIPVVKVAQPQYEQMFKELEEAWVEEAK